jgi:hypothetical protein
VKQEEEEVEESSKSHTNQKQSRMTRRLQQRSWERPQIRFVSCHIATGMGPELLAARIVQAFVSLSLFECENQ